MAFTVNPFALTNAANSFAVDSEGFVQGDALDDPVIRNLLRTGVLATTETLPMWGGVALYESISASGQASIGNTLGRATATTGGSTPLAGFSVFNQANAMVVTTSSDVPLATVGGTISYYRLGSGARIPVQCDPTLASLDGGAVSQQVSWDFTNQKLIAYNSGIGALPVKVESVAVGNSKIVSYNSGTGNATWLPTGATAVIVI